MTEAADILRRYQAGEVFDSEYTFVVVPHYKAGIYKPEDLFDSLTEEERLEFAEKTSEFPILYLWDRAFIYIPCFKIWFRENLDIEEQYFQHSVGEESYLIDLDNEKIYREIDINQVNLSPDDN